CNARALSNSKVRVSVIDQIARIRRTDNLTPVRLGPCEADGHLAHWMTIGLLAEPVNQRPMGPLLRRFFDGNDNKITIGRGWNDMGGGEVPFLPAIRLFH